MTLAVLFLLSSMAGAQPFREIDQALLEADGLLSQAELCAGTGGDGSSPVPALAPPGGLFADLSLSQSKTDHARAVERFTTQCREDVSVDWLLGDPDFASGAAGTESLGDVKGYFMCEAAAKGDVSSCAPLQSIPAKPGALTGNARSSRESCERFAVRLQTAKAIITHDPSAARRCRTMNLGEIPFTPEDQGLLCGILLKAEKDPDGACVEAKKIYTKYFTKRPPDTEPCEVEMRSYWGLEDLECGKLKTDPKKFAAPNTVRTDKRTEEFCLFAHANAAFRRAHAAHDPAVCGDDSPLCRAMMGRAPAACGAYAQKAEEKYCVRLAAGLLPPTSVSAVKTLISKKLEEAPDVCPRMLARAKTAAGKAFSLLNAAGSKEDPVLKERFSKYYNMKAKSGRLERK